jgi:hypothetical protein
MDNGANGGGQKEIFTVEACGIGQKHIPDFRNARMFAMAAWGIILCSALLRLYHINAPLVDGFWDKQIAVANMSRDMAGPPFHLLGGSYDFCISPDGRRTPQTEEIPLYHGLIAWGYRIFGEQDWFGRAVSAAGSLLAVAAFVGLMRREYDEVFALVAGAIFAVCPLLLFYGRAVAPDACMLGFMLAAAYCFRRALDADSRAWLIACGLAGLLATAFKYYGLMILLPMAEMAWRGQKTRGLVKLCLPAAMMIVPLAAWMVLVFFRTANPARHGTYFIFQQPDVLWTGVFWTRLADRFLWKSCGPLCAIMMGVGLYAVLFRRRSVGTAVSWTVMGLAFYFLLGPKSRGHEYYELMMLPGAACWAALGWRYLFRRSDERNRYRSLGFGLGAAWLALTAIVHSPWISNGRFQQHIGFLIAAQSAEKHCSERGRMAAGPFSPQPIIHYARREGWTWQEHPDEPRTLLDQYGKQGAECAVLYFDGKTPAGERRRYDALLKTLPILEHRAGPWGLGGTECEFYVLRLGGADFKAEKAAVKTLPEGGFK